jgi:Zn-dependent M16 (insulinase) family peptidase
LAVAAGRTCGVIRDLIRYYFLAENHATVTLFFLPNKEWYNRAKQSTHYVRTK